LKRAAIAALSAPRRAPTIQLLTPAFAASPAGSSIGGAPKGAATAVPPTGRARAAATTSAKNALTVAGFFITTGYGTLQGGAPARLAFFVTDGVTQRPLQNHYTVYIISSAVRSIDTR